MKLLQQFAVKHIPNEHLQLDATILNPMKIDDFLLELVFSKFRLTQSIKEDLVGLTIKTFDEVRVMYEFLDSSDLICDDAVKIAHEKLASINARIDYEAMSKQLEREKDVDFTIFNGVKTGLHDLLAFI
jgi:hypothetical protein